MGENYINTFKDLTIQPLTAVELGIDPAQLDEHFCMACVRL